MQPTLPIERLAHDLVEIVAARLPAKHPLRPLGLGDDRGWIASAPSRESNWKIDSRYPFDDLDDLPNRLSVPITAIAHEAGPTGAQIGERAQMRVDQVGDLDIVAHTRAVAGRIVLAEDLDLRMEPKRRLDGALDQMGGVGRRLAEAALGIGAGDIEIAQRDVAEIVGL